MQNEEAETARRVLAKEAKAERVRQERLKREDNEAPDDSTSIWRTSPQDQSTLEAWPMLSMQGEETQITCVTK